jgi:hypothetical protein
MKNIFYLFICVLLLSCSSKDCSEETKSINDYYDQQIQKVNDNPGPTGPDYRQIQLLEDERDKKLSNACN